MIKSALLGTGGAGICSGLATGLLFHAVFPRWIGWGWGFAGYMAALAAVYIAIRIIERPSSRWNFENLRKGEDAENRVGQIIEYAITARNCAVAHSVTAIAKVGDIDHLVATPVAVWVIETKYRRVPEKFFPEVLSRIAANTESVRQWVPADTTVRGCLVLAYETDINRRNYSHGKEKITAFTPELLMREMRSEARGSRTLDERLAKDIWKLGRIPV